MARGTLSLRGETKRWKRKATWQGVQEKDHARIDRIQSRCRKLGLRLQKCRAPLNLPSAVPTHPRAHIKWWNQLQFCILIECAAIDRGRIRFSYRYRSSQVQLYISVASNKWEGGE
jgi:hypothetical protein